ncbi:hypothetical protein CR513_06981, partial [Mucuna pruriens]
MTCFSDCNVARAIPARLAPSQPSPTQRPKLLQEKRVAHEGSFRSRKSRRCRLGTGNLEVTKGDRSSETESSPTLLRLFVFESALSRDSVEYSSVEFVYDPSMLRASRMTRSSSNILYELDPEIDRTLRRLGKVRSTIALTLTPS